jgi:hypothetical protein
VTSLDASAMDLAHAINSLLLPASSPTWARFDESVLAVILNKVKFTPVIRIFYGFKIPCLSKLYNYLIKI